MKRSEYKDEVVQGKSLCGFCSTGSHDPCKGGIRNGDGSVILCGCECAKDKPQFCHICHSTEAFDLTRPWLCGDAAECDARLQQRLNNDPILVDMARARSAAATRLANAKPTRTPGACLCCGEATKGGKFLPGHDSKYLNIQIALTKNGEWLKVYDRLRAEVSLPFAQKYQKRVQSA